MQKHHLLLPLLTLLYCTCSAPDAGLRQQAEQAMKAADVAMCAAAVKDGFHAALLQYADSLVVKYDEGQLPVIGRAALNAQWQAQPDTKAISWKPFKAEAAASGDLGYTLGYWKYVAADTTYYGAYCTIWKKQADGAWKFLFDGGNGTPLPAEEWR
ncbi:MAG: hypothetical protein H6575_03145 [Lewinellaceae bacterium]|nr:hypothetical protein [Lewinellaceae bacterium]